MSIIWRKNKKKDKTVAIVLSIISDDDQLLFSGRAKRSQPL